jgi:hypothetical protein
MKPILCEVKIPGHTSGKVPDHKTVGKLLDEVIKKHFMGKTVIVRCVGSQDHPGLTLTELTDAILSSGTDKYNQERVGVGYQEFVDKGIKIDFYGEPFEVTTGGEFMSKAIWEMHHSAIGDRGYGVHIDLVLIYDTLQVAMVMNLYDYQPTSDGYIFKYPLDKQSALLGLIKIID